MGKSRLVKISLGKGTGSVQVVHGYTKVSVSVEAVSVVDVTRGWLKGFVEDGGLVSIGIFALTATAHQGWPANLYSTCGEAVEAAFMWFVKYCCALRPWPTIPSASVASVLALAIFQVWVPRTGDLQPAEATA